MTPIENRILPSNLKIINKKSELKHLINFTIAEGLEGLVLKVVACFIHKDNRTLKSVGLEKFIKSIKNTIRLRVRKFLNPTGFIRRNSLWMSNYSRIQMEFTNQTNVIGLKLKKII